MNGMLNDEWIATSARAGTDGQQKIHQGEEAGITINSKISNLKSQISNHPGALGFDSVDL
jgi:hypothetical protein